MASSSGRPAWRNSPLTGAPEHLQRMLEDLTAALHGLAPPGAASASPAAAGAAAVRAPAAAAAVPECRPTLQSILGQHGISPSSLKDASSLLQVGRGRVRATVVHRLGAALMAPTPSSAAFGAAHLHSCLSGFSYCLSTFMVPAGSVGPDG